jgi:hypothetical protein
LSQCILPRDSDRKSANRNAQRHCNGSKHPGRLSQEKLSTRDQEEPPLPTITTDTTNRPH